MMARELFHAKMYRGGDCYTAYVLDENQIRQYQSLHEPLILVWQFF